MCGGSPTINPFCQRNLTSPLPANGYLAGGYYGDSLELPVVTLVSSEPIDVTTAALPPLAAVSEPGAWRCSVWVCWDWASSSNAVKRAAGIQPAGCLELGARSPLEYVDRLQAGISDRSRRVPLWGCKPNDPLPPAATPGFVRQGDFAAGHEPSGS